MKLMIAAACVIATTAVSADTTKRPMRFDITVTKRGFEPDHITVPAQQPVTLVFKRKTESTCAKSVVIALPDGKKIEQKLPLDTAVPVFVTFPVAGKLGYACSMDMIKGTIVVQP